MRVPSGISHNIPVPCLSVVLTVQYGYGGLTTEILKSHIETRNNVTEIYAVNNSPQMPKHLAECLQKHQSTMDRELLKHLQTEETLPDMRDSIKMSAFREFTHFVREHGKNYLSARLAEWAKLFLEL